MQSVMDWLQALPLLAMFLVAFLITLAVAALIIAAVRVSLRRFGYSEKKPFALRDVVVTATSAMFALMIAFSAAGIWNEANQARAAVQREANALENVRSIAASFPPALRDRVTADVKAYAKQVLDVDWPMMVRKVHFTDPRYDNSEKILIDLVEAVAREAAKPGALPTASACGRAGDRGAQRAPAAHHAGDARGLAAAMGGDAADRCRGDDRAGDDPQSRPAGAIIRDGDLCRRRGGGLFRDPGARSPVHRDRYRSARSRSRSS